MKRHAALLFCALAWSGLLIGFWARPSRADTPAQPTTAPAHVNTAIVPKLNTGFMPRHNEFLEIAQRGNIDVLFMGDSITDWWRSDGNIFGRGGGRGFGGQPGGPGRGGPATQPGGPSTQPARAARRGFGGPPVPGAYTGKPVFDKYFGSWKVANFGIAGDTTQGVLWRLQNGEGQGYSPKAIMLMIGTNNFGGRNGSGNTPQEVAEGNAAVVAELRKDFPDAKILLLGIFPRGASATDPLRAKIKAANEIIAKLNDDQHVFYMDIGDKFLAPDGSIPREIMSDSLHPTTKGYEIWAQAVIDKLKSFLQ
jgi:lysophospholipase L1-like esterase